MLSLAILSLLTATASAQTTTSATLLVPSVIFSNYKPTITVLTSQPSATVYSFLCDENNSGLVSAISHAATAAQSFASAAESNFNSAKSQFMSAAEALGFTPRAALPTGAFVDQPQKRQQSGSGDNSGGLTACVPWKITQGPSTYEVHVTASGVLTLDQACQFGSGGFDSGTATCTATAGAQFGISTTGTITATLDPTDIAAAKATYSVTAGGKATSTGAGAGASGSGSPSKSGSAGGAQSTGLAVALPLPTGVMAWAGAAGGVLAAALAL